MALIRLFARTSQVQIAYAKRLQKGGKNVLLISAMSLQNILVKSSLMRETNAVNLEAFISQKLVPEP